MDFINGNNLVVWRFHDHWRARRPDGITEAQLKTLRWDTYKKTGTEYIKSGVFKLPVAVTLKEFGKDIKTGLQSDNIRVTGNPGLKVRKVGNASNHLRGSVEALSFADAFIVKEADRENDLGEWCRDTVLPGQEKGCIFNTTEEKNPEWIIAQAGSVHLFPKCQLNLFRPEILSGEQSDQLQKLYNRLY